MVGPRSQWLLLFRRTVAVSKDELRDWINERVDSKLQRVDAVVLMDDFPRSTALNNFKRQ
jgi:hypothetical protein